jgi:hypothetical protein
VAVVAVVVDPVEAGLDSGDAEAAVAAFVGGQMIRPRERPSTWSE